MKKCYLFGFGLIALLGVALIGLSMLYALQTAPVTAELVAPAPAVSGGGDTLAFADLNNRDAMTIFDGELAAINTSDQAISSEVAAVHRDDLMGDDDLAMDAAVPPASPAPSAASAPSSWFHARHLVWHRVRWGETLSGIAARFDTSVWRLARLNGIRCVNHIVAGRWLLV